MTNLYLMQWTEYEAGWGNRPDGYSLYTNIDSARKHVENTIKNQEYSCFSSPNWSDFKIIDMQTDIDFSDSDVVWISNKDLDGYRQSQRVNGEIIHKDFPGKYVFTDTGKKESVKKPLSFDMK